MTTELFRDPSTVEALLDEVGLYDESLARELSYAIAFEKEESYAMGYDLATADAEDPNA